MVAARIHTDLVVLCGRRRGTDLVDTLVALGLRVGLGPEVEVKEAGRSYRCAGHGLGATSAATPVVSWDQVVREGAMAILDRERAEAFAASYLGSLEGTLLETLHAFLRHHGSRAKTADELGVHRNTVRARVQQIEDVLAVSLDDPGTRADAWIALQLTLPDA